MTVLQYGYAFHASSCTSSEPLGANIRMNLGTLLKHTTALLKIFAWHSVLMSSILQLPYSIIRDNGFSAMMQF
jgi:hypothetical protein